MRWLGRNRPETQPPNDRFGVLVALGIVLVVGAAWLFGGIAEDVVSGDPLVVVDSIIATWLHAHATNSLTNLMVHVSSLGSPWIVASIASTAALLFLWKRLWFWVLMIVVAVPGGTLINVALKYIFQRPRPIGADSLLALTSYSFPSGHAMAATVLYGTLALFFTSQVQSTRLRLAFSLTAVFVILFVAFSRMYLGVHYLSDVLAGITEGIVWLGLSLGITVYLHGRSAR